MSSTADLIITDARILTMDARQPKAQALAVVGNTIAAVGSADEVAAWRGPQTRMVEAQGASVVPGFNEAHLHLFSGAAEPDQLSLHGVKGFEALAQAGRRFAAERPHEPVLIGQSADYTVLGVGRRVTRHDLDAIVPDRPFIIFAPDHHTAWANTAALAQTGLLHGRQLSPGNEIVMGADGLAEGELRESEAFRPIQNLSASTQRARAGLATGADPVPAPTAAERTQDQATIRRGLSYCASLGITSLQNMDGNFYTLELIDAVNRADGLRCRARVPFHFKTFMEPQALDVAVAMHERFCDERLSSGFVKFFMDGVLESWTAVMIGDYADRPGWRGEPLFEPERFAALATEVDRRGLQIAVHAIGDGAVRSVLDGYAAARRANGVRDSRHRIEHIEVVHRADIHRFAELGVVASMQPAHPAGSMGVPLEPTVSRIGEARWPLAYAWKALRNAGAELVFASDWPISPLAPIASIQAAMVRQKWAPGLPDNRQSLHQALDAYTRAGAYVEYMEERKGRLRPGLLADLVVLSGDLEATAPEALHEVHPRLTICDGAVTFEA